MASEMELTGILALALTAAFSAVALRKYAPETSVVIAVAAGAVILLELLSHLSPELQEIRSLLSQAGLDGSYGAVLLKTLGVCFVCQFTSDACRDAGQTALASKVELAAKLSMLIIALPLLKGILHTAAELLTRG